MSWSLANPKLDGRDGMAVLLKADHQLVAAGQVILADRGFAGAGFETFLGEDLGVRLLRPARKNTADPAPSPAGRGLLRMRQS